MLIKKQTCRGLTKSSICKCGDDIETIQHFSFDCDNYERLRFKIRYDCFVLGIACPPKLDLLIENPVLRDQFLVYVEKNVYPLIDTVCY